MQILFWLAVFLVSLFLEAAGIALVSVWFAGGALAAFVIAATGVSVRTQLTMFVVVSVILFAFIRPMIKKVVDQRVQETNAMGLLGKTVWIAEDVDNSKWSGKGVVEGMEWTVRAEDASCIIRKGSIAKIVGIQGVKLIVAETREEVDEKTPKK